MATLGRAVMAVVIALGISLDDAPGLNGRARRWLDDGGCDCGWMSG